MPLSRSYDSKNKTRVLPLTLLPSSRDGDRKARCFATCVRQSARVLLENVANSKPQSVCVCVTYTTYLIGESFVDSCDGDLCVCASQRLSWSRYFFYYYVSSIILHGICRGLFQVQLFSLEF